MKFMLMMNGPRDAYTQFGNMLNPDELKAHMGFMKRFAKELQHNGELVAAEGLADPMKAVIVRARADGSPEVTDGPFAEAKEFLAGYWIIDVENVQRAHELAARASAAPGAGGKPIGIPIEVREVMSGPPLEV